MAAKPAPAPKPLPAAKPKPVVAKPVVPPKVAPKPIARKSNRLRKPRILDSDYSSSSDADSDSEELSASSSSSEDNSFLAKPPVKAAKKPAKVLEEKNPIFNLLAAKSKQIGKKSPAQKMLPRRPDAAPYLAMQKAAMRR